MSRSVDPKLLYSAGQVQAYAIQNGQERPVNGPETLSLLMVPTSSPFSDLSSTDPTSAAPEEDFYLHLHLPPSLDISLPATSQVFRQPPRSYLIPQLDPSLEAGSFVRIEFPPPGSGLTQEDIDTFETIMAQCTAFMEQGPASSAGKKGHIVLIDEDNGSIVGELGDNFRIEEGTDVHAGSKQPVEIDLPAEGAGNTIGVHNASEQYLRMAKHPAYKDSTLVQNAAVASRLIVTGGEWLSKQISSGADNFVQKTQPNPKPLTFTPTTQARVRKMNNLTHGAVGLSAKTVGQVSRHAQNLGAVMARRGQNEKTKKLEQQGYRPGLLNKSMMAFSTVFDGVDYAARNMLASGSQAATQVVGHKYGEDARAVAGNLASGVRNVGLVYVDAAGVSRRAVIKWVPMLT